MTSPLTGLSGLYRWWTGTLVSCLPLKMQSFLSELNSDVDLIIMHQGDTLFVQNGRGKIIDTVSLAANVAVDVEISDLPAISTGRDGQVMGGDSKLAFDAAGNNFDVAENSSVHNVIHLNVSRNEGLETDPEDEDPTLSLYDAGAKQNEDTVMLDNEPGYCAPANADSSDSENTLIFCNDGGKIRQVLSDGFQTPNTYTVEMDESISAEQNSTDEAMVYSLLIDLLKKYQGNKKCIYLLPEDKVFTVNLSYPAEAVINLASVLKYDLEKHIPLNIDEIHYFYTSTNDTASGQVAVEVAVIKTSDYLLLNRSLESHTKKGLMCSTQSLYKKHGSKINFLQQENDSNWFSFINIRNLHAGFNWLLLGCLLTLPFFLFHQEIQRLEHHSADDMARVKNILGSINSINSEAEFGSMLSTRVNQSPRAVELLSTLSSQINSQAWLSRFTLKDHEIKIKGEADSATSVSDELNRTGLFESIKFVSSIVKNPRNGKETFELLLVLKSDA